MTKIQPNRGGVPVGAVAGATIVMHISKRGFGVTRALNVVRGVGRGGQQPALGEIVATVPSKGFFYALGRT